MSTRERAAQKHHKYDALAAANGLELFPFVMEFFCMYWLRESYNVERFGFGSFKSAQTDLLPQAPEAESARAARR
jgi:hypothetical protein